MLGSEAILRLSRREALFDAVQDELDGEGGEEDSEDAREDVRSGLSEEVHYAGGEKQGGENEQQDHQQHDRERRKLHGVTTTGIEEDRRDGAGPGEQGDGEREHGYVLFVRFLFLLAHGSGAPARGVLKDHVQRQQEEQDPSRYPERPEPYAQSVQ